jgi:hypothetical protein
MQAQRYELKYIIPVSLKLPIRAFVASYLDLDAFAERAPDHAYPIHSIYLDSPGLRTYQATLNGDRNRYKLRVRYYDDRPESPVFLEMKRRLNDVIQKKRCTVPRAALPGVLAGDTSCLRPKDLDGHATFCHHMHQIGATPRAHVAYKREAWVSRHDNSVRVTMDRDVSVEPKFDLEPGTAMSRPAHPFGGQMVLELKYTNRFPEWFRELVRTFHLMQSGGPKYSGGIEKYGERHFMRSAGSGLERRVPAARVEPAGEAASGDFSREALPLQTA